MRILNLFITLPFSLFAIWFSVSNTKTATVSLDFTDFSYDVPLYAIIGLSFILGFFVGALIINLRRLKDKMTIRTLLKANKRLSKDIKNLSGNETYSSVLLPSEKKVINQPEKPYFFNKESDIIQFKRNF